LALGVTGVARCWKLTRRDGVVFGFTDHDRDLSFDGTVFRAGTGLSAAALSQTTGLAVDNGEAIGALSDAAVTEADISAGRFDGSEVEAWLVQWAEPANRVMQFRGSIGEISRANGAFTAELRGLAEALNVPDGARLPEDLPGRSGRCGVRGRPVRAGILGQCHGRLGRGWPPLSFFRHSSIRRALVRTRSVFGARRGGYGAVRCDQARHPPGPMARGRSSFGTGCAQRSPPVTAVRLTAGCDKRMETCRLKFSNLLNFRGFPDIPGDDWLVAHPTRVSARDGGSRR
jgi:hypothetical protein